MEFTLSLTGSVIASGKGSFRDRPLENLWGGGGLGAGEVQKKGKIKWKKILARQLILKDIHAMA